MRIAPRELLLDSFRRAVEAADPLKILPQHLPSPPRGRTVVVGAGKAAASMALAVEQCWPSEAVLEGLVVTRYGHGLLTNRIKVLEAAHPLPDVAGEQGAREILRRARALGPEDLLLVLVSGGGSALLALPAPGVSAADLRETTRQLLRSGAPIQAINTVRKHLSAIQGGRLAAATKARVAALIVSDVAGDTPSDIASGPCAPDPTSYADALQVLHSHDIEAPEGVLQYLDKGVRGEVSETPKPGDRIFARVENRVIAGSQASLQAGATFLRGEGIACAVLGDSVTGEAREVARVYAALARQVKQRAEFRDHINAAPSPRCTARLSDSLPRR